VQEVAVVPAEPLQHRIYGFAGRVKAPAVQPLHRQRAELEALVSKKRDTKEVVSPPVVENRKQLVANVRLTRNPRLLDLGWDMMRFRLYQVRDDL
jgi:hypothetical protein